MSLIIKEIERKVDFITSDQHFGHKNISKFAGRGFDNDLTGMNEMLVRRWNEVVSPDDTVVQLGDLAMGKTRDNLKKYVPRLNGHLIFMPGNHDLPTVARFSSGIIEQITREEYFASKAMQGTVKSLKIPYMEAGFEEILPETGATLVTSAGNEAHLSHYPYKGSDFPHKTEHLVWLEDDGRLLVHGHTHSPRMTDDAKRGNAGARMFHIGVDAHNLYPVSADVIEKWIDNNS